MLDSLLSAGRSFLLALATLLIVSGLRVFGLLGEGYYVTIVLGTVGAYITRSIVQDFKPETP